MISTASEDLISFNDIPKYLDEKFGHKIHIASIYRWVKVGLSGVRLETIKVGSKRFTSAQALDRLFNGATIARDVQNSAANVQVANRNARNIENEARKLGI